MDDRKCYRCVGGPWNQQSIWLQTRSTALLSIRGRIGRYVANPGNTKLLWEPKK